MANKIQMMSHDKEWQIVNGVETLVPVEQIDIDPITDSSAVQIEGHRTLEETLTTKHQMTPEIDETKIMSKVGGVYHQNVVDGAYEEAILYGNSKVNLMEDDTTTAQSIPLTFTSFNNGLQKELALGTNTVAPMLKGATLINRALTSSVSLASGEKFYIHNLKGNTVHTVSFKFTTKNTNAGVVIESCTGETYLENSMHKTGLGDNAIFTVTTHANADSIAIVNNAAYGGETIKLDDIMVIEGDQTLMNLTFFKGMRSVELVKPLTNLFTNDLRYYTAQATATNSNGNVTVTSTASSSWTMSQYYLSSLKPNTKYLVMWDSLTTTQTSTTQQEILICVVDNINNVKLGGINEDSKCLTKRSIVFDTGNRDLSQIVLRIHATLSNTETGTTTVKGLRVFEWDDATSRALDLQSIGYFSGTKNVSIPNFKTNSKNLYPYGDVNFTNSYVGWCDAKGNTNMYGDIAQKSKCRFLLRKGTYTFFYNGEGNTTYAALVDDKENTIAGGKTSFTLQQDTYLTLRLKTLEADTQTTLTNIRIERGSIKTDYVAYDTRQYKPDNQEIVVLRSLPNGVCDTFNLQTGEYVQRVGEIILNGSEPGYAIFTTKEPPVNTSAFYFQSDLFGTKNSAYTQTYICDSLKFNDTYTIDEECFNMHENRIRFRINKSKLSTDNVAGIKEYLISNPITVQYQLAEPVIKQIPIVNSIYNASSRVDFKEGKNASFRCFGNPTYLEIGSLSPVNPIVEPIINIPLNARLKANTSYTVLLDRTGSSLNVDLGGTTVSTSNSTDNEFIIKTPTGMLSHNQIRFSGNGSVGRVMVFEGDIRGIELPYFMGINNVKMPIVRNSGKNLVDFDRDKTNWWVNNEGLSKGDDTGLYYSVMIKASGGNRYRIAMKNTNRSHYGFLDEDFNILVLNANNRDTVVAPKNTKYLIWYLSSTGLTSENNVQIELVENNNLIPTSYEQYRGNDICIAQGEIGLSQDMFEQGGFSTKSGSTYEAMKYDSTIRLRSKSLIQVKPNTTYYIKNNLPQTYFNIYQWNENIEFMQGTSKTNNTSELLFTTTNDTHYIHFLFSKAGDKTITVSEFDWSFFQFLELDSTVQLRSLPNGVKDELNLLTGEYIQRVGETVLDGSEPYWSSNQIGLTSDSVRTWQIIGSSTNNNFESVFPNMKYMVATTVTNFHNNRLPNLPYDSFFNGSTSAFTLKNQLLTQNEFQIRLPKNILSSHDVDGIKQWLQSNPITVQYELAEPIISYPRIVSNTQEREVGVKLPNGVCDTYNPSTGVTVKRVGKVVLDGSEKWNVDPGWTHTANLIRFASPIGDMKLQYNNGDLLCDKLPVVQEGVVPCIYNRWNNYIYIDFKASDIGVTFGTDNNDTMLTKMKNHMANLKPTLWYELKNPIVTTDIVLPNGVHDEYNPLTGLYTKRVGYVELDGGERSLNYRVHSNGYLLVNITDIKMTSLETQPTNNILSNVSVRSVDDVYSNTNITTTSIALHHQDKSLMVRAINNSTTATNVDEYKQYLSQNPIKVWYELETPITYQLTPYFGLPMPYAYKDGYLIMDSAYEGQTLPPEIKYKLLANRTGQITQNNIKLQNHTSKLSNLEAMLVEATLQSMYEREMMAFNLEMVNINLINLEE